MWQSGRGVMVEWWLSRSRVGKNSVTLSCFAATLFVAAAAESFLYSFAVRVLRSLLTFPADNIYTQS
jgi:hypothetical protein